MRWRSLIWLSRILSEDPSLEMERFRSWLRTLRDRRFYRSGKGLGFDIVDRYFRQFGFEYSKGMSLSPPRKILLKFREVAGLLHPREQVHAVAPGDPIFQMGAMKSPSVSRMRRDPRTPGSYRGDPTTNGSFRRDPTSGSRYQFDGASSGKYLDLPTPWIIITSQRIIHREDTPQGSVWISHFYSEMIDEAPAILSWSDSRGWRRAMDNENDRYYNNVRYYSVNGQRYEILCRDRYVAGLVSWIVSQVAERNEKRRGSKYPAPSARQYLNRNIRDIHLSMPETLHKAKKLMDVAHENIVETTPLPNSKTDKKQTDTP